MIEADTASETLDIIAIFKPLIVREEFLDFNFLSN
jgi:hypothetical protein